MDNPITTFLSMAVPWDASGWISIHAPYVPPDAPPGTKPRMPGQAFKDVNAALRYIYARRAKADLFVCMSLQPQMEARVNRHGRRSFRAIRRKDLALLLRAFWLDVDIKHGFFRNTEHALEEFGKWRRAVGLPEPSLLVLTGSGGFHVYWVLDTPIDLVTWQPAADALANAAVASFKPMPGPDGEERQLDTGLTTNAACLLRIPDTFNFKHNPPHPTQLGHVGKTYPLSAIQQPLAPYMRAYRPAELTFKSMKPAAAFAGMTTPTSLTAGLDDRWRPAAEEVAAEGVCPWFARVLHTRGAGCSEPEWFTSLQVAYFCQQASELVHELSNGHATYTEEETDKKFALVEESHASGRLGWPQCQTIHMNGAPECRICPHLSAGKSPLNFVPMAPAEQPVPISRTGKVEPPIAGYVQDTETGIIYALGKDDGSPNKPISLYPIINLRSEVQQDDGSGRSAVVFDTYTDATRSRSVVIPYEDLNEPRLFGQRLSKNRMVQPDPTPLRKYLASFVERLRERRITAANSEPYGWSMADGKPVAFNYNKRYNCAGAVPVAPLNDALAHDYQPNGSLERWKENAKLIIQQERYDLITVIAASVGAVLTPFTGVDGTVIHVYGPSGEGKSHTVRIGQSMWARPKKAAAILGDTTNALNGRLGILHNLPLFFDEIKLDEEMRRIVEVIFTMTQGKTRARMSAAAELREVYEFCTMLIVASNTPLTDFISEYVKTTAAGLLRIYEIAVQPNTTGTGLILPTVAQRMMGELTENYGHPGAIVSEFLGKTIDPVMTAVGQACDQFNNMVSGTTDERFWIATMAVCYIGARIINKVGLTEINERKLLEFLVENFHRLRSRVSSSPVDITNPAAVERYVQEYYNLHQRWLLITDKVPQGKGRIPKGSIVIEGNQLDYRDGVRMRYAHQEHRLRISLSNFRRWLSKECRVGPNEIVEAAKSVLGATVVKKFDLTAGTELPGGREDVLEFKNPSFIDRREQ